MLNTNGTLMKNRMIFVHERLSQGISVKN
jgi:hypothetical protein